MNTLEELQQLVITNGEEENLMEDHLEGLTLGL